MNAIKNFFNDEAGVTAIEYAMIAAFIAVIALAGIKLIGTQVAALFTKVTTATA
ncbi:Flp family type IVb pilin [Rugamonas sp.]|uniref:Flp family type IVb pilin n=1 Tax=Rugamonas sp. TaxID=1926287 RepID=UPI0025FA1655|nr:Flp family type IVb pilin [Rugamonas sp.]